MAWDTPKVLAFSKDSATASSGKTKWREQACYDENDLTTW